MTLKKSLLLIIIAAGILGFYFFDLGQYLNLPYLKAKQAEMDAFYQANPIQTNIIFFVTYIVVTALSLPGAAILTLTAGAIFGLLWGTVLSSFASSIGGTLAFLASRYLFRDEVQKRFGKNLEKVNRGITEDGPFYLFTLRLVPIFPFFIINLVMGLTPMRAVIFYCVSQIGMLPGTLVYVNAGMQLAKIETIGDILSAQLIASFVLLGLFPLLTKKFVALIKDRRKSAADPLEKNDNG